MKRIALILAFSLLATIAVAAQDKPKAEAPKPDAAKAEAKPAVAAPTVDEILDKALKAVGGREAVEKFTSRLIKGSLEIEAVGATGTIEVYAKAPNKTAVVANISGFGTVNEVFDGAKGWSSDPAQGLREWAGSELATRKRKADFYTELNLKKHYTKMEVKGKEKVGSYEAWMIEATPAEGSAEKLFFDVNTGLLVRQDAETESPAGKMMVETYLDDYKVVDGVKIAHSMKNVTPMFAISMKFTEIKHNVEIEDAKFGKPAGN
jgi:hypothetical protein